MNMNSVHASGEILKVYQTGDRPILVLCSDGFHYICKYKQPGYSAYKLVNELIGCEFAKVWEIATPANSLVTNDPIIWSVAGISHDPKAPLLGSRKMEDVFDLSDFNCNQVKVSSDSLFQLLKIALFDLWLANEDRTCNNYNLLYDLKQEKIVSIDYGGIFNSGILNNPICQLTREDSIITSNLYYRLKTANLQSVVSQMHIDMLRVVAKCKRSLQSVLVSIPVEWNVDTMAVKKKTEEVFSAEWLTDTWFNFKELLAID